MKPLTHYVDLLAVHALQNRYGNQLQQLDTSTRLHLAGVLAAAAAGVEKYGATEQLDVALAAVHPVADAELLGHLRQLDGELTDWREAITLAAGMATHLGY